MTDFLLTVLVIGGMSVGFGLIAGAASMLGAWLANYRPNWLEPQQRAVGDERAGIGGFWIVILVTLVMYFVAYMYVGG